MCAKIYVFGRGVGGSVRFGMVSVVRFLFGCWRLYNGLCELYKAGIFFVGVGWGWGGGK